MYKMYFMNCIREIDGLIYEYILFLFYYVNTYNKFRISKTVKLKMHLYKKVTFQHITSKNVYKF